MRSASTLKGFVTVDLWRPTRSGKLELVDSESIENLITQVGDQYYGERAAGLGSLGIAGVESVRQGKVFDIELNASGRESAEAALSAACERLLANTVIENYRIEILG